MRISNMVLDFYENDYFIQKRRKSAVKIADFLRKLHKMPFLDLKIDLNHYWNVKITSNP